MNVEFITDAYTSDGLRLPMVHFESKEKDGMILGHTANYTPVKVHGEHSLFGTFRDVKITDAKGDCCIGEII